MAKGSGTTKSAGSSGASTAKVDISQKIGMTERQFASVTGQRFGLRTSDYQTSLAIVNGIPDNQKMWTGHNAKEVKDALKKIIRAMGGTVNVKLKDYIIDE